MHKLFPLEERLLVLLNLAHPSAARSAELKNLGGAPGVDWDKLLALAELNGVNEACDRGLEASGLKLRMPKVLARQLECKIAPQRELSQKRALWSAQVLEALHDAGIEVIMLETGETEWMVRREDVEEATDVLRHMGFRSLGASKKRHPGGLREISPNRHHAEPFVSEDLSSVVHLSWGLVSPLSPWRPDTLAVWKRKVAVQVGGAPAFRLSTVDRLLHLCVHLPFFKTGLKELSAVYNLVLDSAMDWDGLGRLAHRWRAEDAVFRALALADALMELGIPGKHWRGWSVRASGFTIRDTEKRLLDTAELLRSRSLQAARIEKAFAVFSLTENYPERMKAWVAMYRLLLWPDETELAKIAAERELASSRARWVRARLRAPVQLWNAMARDHGHLPLAATALANARLVARETFRHLLQRRASSGVVLMSERPLETRLLEVLE